MNTRLVNTAADVLHAAMEQGRVTPAGLAYALESAQLLQSPETAAELARLRARVAELTDDRNRDVAVWLGKKAREYRSTRGREHAVQAEVLERMADKVRRGAIRPPLEDPHDSPLHHTYAKGRDIEFPQQEAPRV
ncbi:hypothetical protein ACIPJK_07400 [Streptomyces roseus]|uniref:hypothetical protein n=1 Tax=Streptomyces roseus TaxID=66430 RepID=UPI003830CA0E